MAGGPGFLDLDDVAAQQRLAPPVPAIGARPGGAEGGTDDLSHGPMLLDPDPGTIDRLDVGWAPRPVGVVRQGARTLLWLVCGFGVLLATWVALSSVSFLLTQFRESLAQGVVAASATLVGFGLIAYAARMEWTAYRAIRSVEHVRRLLAEKDTPREAALDIALTWLSAATREVPDPGAVDRALVAATTAAEIVGILRLRVAMPLAEEARRIGRQAAVEDWAMTAICPHPALDGLIVAWCGVRAVRRVAGLYGFRPSCVVTVCLIRKVAATAIAAGTVDLLAQRLADASLGSVPLLGHLAGAIPGTSIAARRLYRLASIAAEACSPVSAG